MRVVSKIHEWFSYTPLINIPVIQILKLFILIHPYEISDSKNMYSLHVCLSNMSAVSAE